MESAVALRHLCRQASSTAFEASTVDKRRRCLQAATSPFSSSRESSHWIQRRKAQKSWIQWPDMSHAALQVRWTHGPCCSSAGTHLRARQWTFSFVWNCCHWPALSTHVPSCSAIWHAGSAQKYRPVTAVELGIMRFHLLQLLLREFDPSIPGPKEI